jgi:hypothetical protein
MPKTKISEYSATANSNTDVASINIDEGCAPSGINNAIRAVMGHLKDFQAGTNSDSFNGPTNGAHNGSVGATTPAAGAFTTLSASSTVSGTGFSTYLASPPAIGGTAAAAGSFTTLSATGNVTLGDASTDTLNVGNGGLVKDASGNVGIGTSSPATQLHVKNAGGNSISILGQYGSGTIAQMGAYANQVDIKAYNGTNDVMTFTTGASERMRIDSSGNVGIGTTSPDYQFEVSGSSASTTTLGVGISVENSNATSNSRAGIVFRNYDNYGASIWSPRTGSTAGALVFGTNNAAGTAETNIVERARIDSSGNLLVGTTSALGVGFTVTPNATTPYWQMTVNTATAANNLYLYNQNATNFGYRFYVSANGGVYNYSGNNVNLSDERTKTNIELAGSYLDKICAIPVKLFNYKDEAEGEQRTLGVIAQDVEVVAPEFVNNDGWEGSAAEDGSSFKTVYSNDMMFALMKCIQEQQALITTLTERITALEQA